MEYVTASYWQKEEKAGLFLSLQQRRYRKSGRNAVSACISDDGKIVRYLQNRMDDELSGKLLWQTEGGDFLQECWREELSRLGEDCNYAGILCAEERVLLFSHGRMRNFVFFRRFGKVGWKTLDGKCMVGEVEPGTAILMADNAFLNFCEEELAECLKPQITENISAEVCEKRAEKRLKELGKKAAAQGGRHMGAVWILPVSGGKIWREL